MILLISAVFLACLPQSHLQIQQREIHEQGIHYAVDVKYPEIDNADVFNAAVRQAVGSLSESFKKGGMPEVNPNDGPADGYLNGSYSVVTLKNGIVSVLIDYSEYTPGAAHPWGVMASVNYDSPTCRVLTLADLFRPGVKYVSRVSELAIAYLDGDVYADHDAIRRGAGPVEGNFKVFTLTDTDLILHFPMYQVASGAAGEQTAVIPLEKLAPLLRKHAPPLRKR
jgi:hypothetical protein